MDQRFPRSISALRVASFVSTAAWIQGTTADGVHLPEDALNNFLRRNGVRTKKARQAPAPPPPEEEEEEEEEDEDEDEDEEDGEEDDKSSLSSGDSGSEAGVSSATGSSGASSLEDGEVPPEGLPGGTTNNAVAGNSPGDPTASIDSGPGLGGGALAGIIVGSIIGALAIIALSLFLVRRKRRAKREREAAQDEEGRAGQPMAMQGAAPSVIEPVHLRPESIPRAPPPMEPAYLRPESQADVEPQMQVQAEARPTSVAPSGQWVAVPPWQEESPTWRDPQPWRQSQPSVAVGPKPGPMAVGLPANPSPRATRQNAGAQQPEYDRQTQYSESTIFAYK